LYSNYFLIDGEDYGAVPNKVTFSAGKITVSFDVRIKGDELLESNETFQLSINSTTLPNGVTFNDSSVVTVTIVDNDGMISTLYIVA